MAILQAILTLISRSAGRVLNAVFGWAVRALFGQPSPKEQAWLTGLVAAAALWPVLLVGVALPRVVTLVVAFVPLGRSVPAWIIRLSWLGLALLVPIVVGIVVASKAPPGAVREPVLLRLLRGFPITLALAASFFFMFVTVPFLRLHMLACGQKQEQLSLLTSGESYDDVARQIAAVLARHRLEVIALEPPWWMRAPSAILYSLGGRAFRGYVPQEMAFFAGEGLQAALYPSALLIRGERRRCGWAHALLAEALSHSRALQTTDPEAQRIEKELKGVWRALDDCAALDERGSEALAPRVRDLARTLATTSVPFEDWQVLYRQALQLARAVDGKPQLLDDTHLAPPPPPLPAIAGSIRALFASLFGRRPRPA